MKPKSTHEHYDDIYLGHILFGLQGEIGDLERWSVYNDDQMLNEIVELKEEVTKLLELFDFKKYE